MKRPCISVIMPVHNSELFVLLAVNSILEQTFNDFEFIIIDDASTDDIKSILNDINDPRIIRLNNKSRSGNYKCRNQGLKIAKGKYIAVMDSDDVAYPNRLMNQYEFMESNPQYLAAGSDIEFFSANSSPVLFERLRDPEQIKVHLLKDNVCTHPTLIIRKEVFDYYNIKYNEDYCYSADYDLLLQISRIGRITNIPEPLLLYRQHKDQISNQNRQAQLTYRDQIRLKQLSLLKMRPSVDEVMLHLCLMSEFPIPESKLSLAEKWCNKLLVKSSRLDVYNQDFLFQFLKERLVVTLRNTL